MTVSGTIDLQASDGSKAHLAAGDIAYLDDTTGKGHTAKVEGGSISMRVEPGFDVKAWARGNKLQVGFQSQRSASRHPTPLGANTKGPKRMF